MSRNGERGRQMSREMDIQTLQDMIREAKRAARENEPTARVYTKDGKPTIALSKSNELARRIAAAEGYQNRYKVIEQYLKEKLGGREFTLSDGRVAVMDNSDARKMAYKAGDKRTAQLSAIEEIIKNAEYVKEDANAIHDKFNAFYYYSVNVEFNGETDELWLNVGKNKFDGTNHIYAITYNNDNGTASPLKSLSRPEGIAIPNSPVNDIIPEKGENVKENRNLRREISASHIWQKKTEWIPCCHSGFNSPDHPLLPIAEKLWY